MATKKRIEFDPDAPYTIGDVARILGHSLDWVKRHAIKSRKLQFCPLGDKYVVMDRWITDYVIANGTFYGDENCPVDNRGRKKKTGSKT